MEKLRAYQELKKQLEKKCVYYERLGADGDIGKDFYTKEGTSTVPEHAISEFLQGGITSSFSAFEEFLHIVLYESLCELVLSEAPVDNKAEATRIQFSAEAKNPVRDELKKKRLQSLKDTSDPECTENCLDPMDVVNWWRKKLDKRKFDITKFKQVFRKYILLANDKNEVNPCNFQTNKDLELLLKFRHFTYCYPLVKSIYSKMSFTTEDEISEILNLWYGMRCVAAHGYLAKTMETGVLKEFYSYSALDTSEIVDKDKFKNTSIVKWCSLTKFVHNNLRESVHRESVNDTKPETVSDPIFRQIKAIPNLTDFENIVDKSKHRSLQTCFDSLELPHAIPHAQPSSASELSKEYGLYHIGRVAYFTCTLGYKKRMYITYRMFVRINQFLLLLSFRIQLALQKWLHDYGEKHKISRLTEKWIYKIKDVQDQIEKEETQHEEKIKDISQGKKSLLSMSCFF